MIIPNIWKNKIHVPNHQTDELTKHDYFDMKSGSAICSLPSLTQDVGKLNISYKSLVDFNLDIPKIASAAMEKWLWQEKMHESIFVIFFATFSWYFLIFQAFAWFIVVYPA